MEGSGTSWDWIFDPDHVARITAKLRDGHGKEEWPEPGNQSAAVLVPIMAVDGVPSVLFTLRSRDLSRHRNQVRCVYVAYHSTKRLMWCVVLGYLTVHPCLRVCLLQSCIHSQFPWWSC